MKSTVQALPFLLPVASAAYIPQTRDSAPPAFILAGDSTTAVQSSDGGGWGTGFLSFVVPPATGVDKGHNGFTTVSFVQQGDWGVVQGLASQYQGSGNDVYVTIQFGHNDQSPNSGITLDQYQSNLVGLAENVTSWGATPLLVTPLSRRIFSSNNTETDSLHDQRLATIAAAQTAGATCLDLNAASLAYVEAIGQDAAQAYNLIPTDTTHLNDWGSVVFGRIVADLLLQQKPELGPYIAPNQTLSTLIAEGLPA
ncbi:hypothetical protein CHU98_g1032 [Xylaria longipes]|nr:hypothetical protein CHU98_g1032 [Xylaria longipes]